MRRFLLILVGLFIPLRACGGEVQAGDINKGMENVSPVEDLMREHGVLNRILLIYEEIIRRINNLQPFSTRSLQKSAVLVREFIENYHEKLEEDYLFTRFEKVCEMVDLVEALREQHRQGRTLTDSILSHFTDEDLNHPEQKEKLKITLRQFIFMYRPHAAREDTVLFPAFKTLLTREETESLGEVFEEKEKALFGKDGYNRIVEEVEEIERELGIYTLSQFTPGRNKSSV